MALRTWCRCVLSGWKGLLLLRTRLIMTVMVSVIGRARTSKAATGETTLPVFWVTAMAKKASTKPRVMLPASPMKSFEGNQLKRRKAARAPTKAMAMSMSSGWPLSQASRPKALKATSEVPPARPSRPSIMLTALMTPRTQNMVMA